VPRGTVEGDTWTYTDESWTYTDESKMGDKTVKSRYVMKQLDKKSYTFKYEMQGPDGQWKTVMEGRNTRS
jgi:acyl-CoA thioesterase FadM